MNDFLGRLAARAQGEAAVVKPRVRSRYESGEAAAPPAPEGWGEEVMETAGGREEARHVKDVGEGRDGRRDEAWEAPSLEAPAERRAVSPASPAWPEPTLKAVETREARLPGRETVVARTVETAARPVPAPPPPEAPAQTALTPAAVPAPAPRRSEPRVPPPKPGPRLETPEPGPRLERRVEKPGPAVPAPPEAGPAVRMGQPAEPRTAPLPTVGPRRAIPDLGPAPAGRAETAGDTEEVVRVSIGRIDVHAGPPPVQAPAPRRPADPRLSLSNYLAGRDERRRR